MSDFSNFNTATPDENGRVFERLAAGTYVMRVVGYNRSKTRKGDDALIFKLVVVQSLSPGGSSSGDCLWFVNLTERGIGFVKEAVLAVSPDGWEGDLTSDDSVKSVFLGKCIKTIINMEFRNGKTYPSVSKVASFSSEDHPHGAPEPYWNVSAMRSHSAPTEKKDPVNQETTNSNGNGSSSSAYDDDDIPF